MRAFRDLLYLIPAATAALALPFAAYPQAAGGSSAWQAGWYPTPRSSLGLHVNRSQIGFLGGEGRAQGLNLSLIGRAPLGPSLGVFGKLGTTYGGDASALGASPAPDSGPGFGLSYGAGFSFTFTPRFSATLEWDSNDFRFPGSRREPVRSTSLGLQYRY